MMGLQLAIDISNHQGDLPLEQFQRWYAEGARTVICGTDGTALKPLVFAQQASKARQAGLEVEAYIYLYFGDGGVAYDVVGRTNTKLDVIDAVGGIKRVWIDCEDTTSGLGPSDLVGLIAAARDEVEKRRYVCGIYTGAWWWTPYTGDERGFWNLPLWLASYDGVHSLDMAPLGGWTSMVRKQYTDRGSLGGYGPLDLNVEAEPAPTVEAPVAGQPEATRPVAVLDLDGARAALRDALAKLGG